MTLALNIVHKSFGETSNMPQMEGDHLTWELTYEVRIMPEHLMIIVAAINATD